MKIEVKNRGKNIHLFTIRSQFKNGEKACSFGTFLGVFPLFNTIRINYSHFDDLMVYDLMCFSREIDCKY